MEQYQLSKERYLQVHNSVVKFNKHFDIIAIADKWENDYDEFSTRSCECCGDNMAGERYSVLVEGDYENFKICTDCRNVLEFGEFDDLTLLDIEFDYMEALEEIEEE